MALIERRRRPFGIKIQPVLRDRHPASRGTLRTGDGARTAQTCRSVVHRLCKRVLHGRGESVTEAPAHLQLPGVADRAAIRRHVDKPRRTGRTGIHRAGRIGVREELLHQMTAFGPKIRRQDSQRRG